MSTFNPETDMESFGTHTVGYCLTADQNNLTGKFHTRGGKFHKRTWIDKLAILMYQFNKLSCINLPTMLTAPNEEGEIDWGSTPFENGTDKEKVAAIEYYLCEKLYWRCKVCGNIYYDEDEYGDAPFAWKPKGARAQYRFAHGRCTCDM